MAELMLGVEVNFSHGFVELREKKERVVAEATGALGLGEDFPGNVAFGREDFRSIAGEREDTSVTGGAIGDFGHPVEEAEVVAFIGRERGSGNVVGIVGVAGGADTGSVVDGRDFESGVIGENQLARQMAAIELGLKAGVFGESRACFLGRGNIGKARQWEDFDGGVLGGDTEVAQLAGVGGCDVKGARHINILIGYRLAVEVRVEVVAQGAVGAVRRAATVGFANLNDEGMEFVAVVGEGGGVLLVGEGGEGELLEGVVAGA